jgi:hypothetical protein
VIGSAIVRLIETYSNDPKLEMQLESYVGEIARALPGRKRS